MRAPILLYQHQTFGMVSLLNFNHPKRYGVVSHCDFNYISLVSNDNEHLFMCLFAISISSLVKYLSNLLPILKLGCLLYY